MKSIKILILYFILIILAALLTGCSALENETANKIVRPENKVAPLQGQWIVRSCHEDSLSSNMVDSSLIGKFFAFEGSNLVFDDVVWSNINYKIKRVNAGEYFLHKTPAATGTLDLSSSEVYVITVSSEDKFLYEFVKLDDDRIIANIDNRLYCLVRAEEMKDGIYEGLVAAENEKGGSEAKTEYSHETYNTGLLLGMRIPVRKDQDSSGPEIEEYSYKTLWISMTNYQPGPVLSADDIYLPRKDGFWKLKVSRESVNGGVRDAITASMVTGSKVNKDSSQRPVQKKPQVLKKSLQKTILYVGNDYICMENAEEIVKPGSSSSEWRRVLRTVPVDNIDNTEGIKLSDFAGENGKLALELALSKLLAVSNNSIKRAASDDQELNFALFRKSGHWFFKGRLNLSGGPLDYVDFNINIIPPADMVAYDILHLPWSEITDKVPDVTDAYTSPNKDLAVILTSETILLYAMKDNRLSSEPLKKLPLPEGGVVIMAEWATGKYVEYWDSSFRNNNKVEIMD